MPCGAHHARFVIHDLLECYTTVRTADQPMPLHARLLECTNTVVLAQAARLLNMLSSLSAGRAYLRISSTFMDVLTRVTTRADGDDHPAMHNDCRRHLVCTLQKLSLSRSAQTAMIRGGVGEWAVRLVVAHAAVVATAPFTTPKPAAGNVLDE